MPKDPEIDNDTTTKPSISIISEATLGRAYQLSDIAMFLDLNGHKDLANECRNLASKVYETGIKTNENIHNI